jgi:TusA-related sulfurtransferase
MDAWLDAGAENCGRLIGLVADTIARLSPGQSLGVAAYDPSSQVDLAAWCRMTGHRLRSVAHVTDHLEFVIEKAVNAKEVSHGTRHAAQHPR